MTQQQAEQIAEQLKQAVFARTKIPKNQLQCPREKSDMTPCAARDGHLVAVLDSWGNPLCVGCEHRLDHLLAKELEKH